MDFLFNAWPWYVSGPLITLTMFLLLRAGKKLGMSSNLKTICSAGGAGKFAEFFRYDWKKSSWNLVVVLGVVIGGFVGSQFLTTDTQVELGPETRSSLQEMGFSDPGAEYLPAEVFGPEALGSPLGIGVLILGGLLVGFGTRYAGGCTSGHAISGLSNLQVPSLIAVIGFFIGGLIMTHLIFPFIFTP